MPAENETSLSPQGFEYRRSTFDASWTVPQFQRIPPLCRGFSARYAGGRTLSPRNTPHALCAARADEAIGGISPPIVNVAGSGHRYPQGLNQRGSAMYWATASAHVGNERRHQRRRFAHGGDQRHGRILPVAGASACGRRRADWKLAGSAQATFRALRRATQAATYFHVDHCMADDSIGHGAGDRGIFDLGGRG